MAFVAMTKKNEKKKCSLKVHLQIAEGLQFHCASKKTHENDDYNGFQYELEKRYRKAL